MDNKNLKKQYRQYLKSLKVSSRISPDEILTFEDFIRNFKRKKFKRIATYLIILFIIYFSASSALDIDKMVKNNDLYLLRKLEILNLFDWESLNEYHLSIAIIYKNFDLACEILQKNKTIEVRPSLQWVKPLSKSKKASNCIRSDERFTLLNLGVKKYPDADFFKTKNLTELETGLKLGANPNKWYFYGYKRTKIPEYIVIPTKETKTCASFSRGGKGVISSCARYSLSIETDRIDLPEGISLEDAREMERKYQSKNEFSVDVALKFKMLKMYYWPLDYPIKYKKTKIADLLMKYGAKPSPKKKSTMRKDIILL